MALDVQGMAPLLQVFDMPTAIRFYRDVLGFELVATSDGGEQSDWVLLRRAGVELMLNTAYEADARPPTPDATRIAILPWLYRPGRRSRSWPAWRDETDNTSRRRA